MSQLTSRSSRRAHLGKFRAISEKKQGNSYQTRCLTQSKALRAHFFLTTCGRGAAGLETAFWQPPERARATPSHFRATSEPLPGAPRGTPEPLRATSEPLPSHFLAAQFSHFSHFPHFSYLFTCFCTFYAFSPHFPHFHTFSHMFSHFPHFCMCVFIFSTLFHIFT